jgi:hypothetical protein
MLLWSHWWLIVSQLRPACSRQRTFLWLAVTLAAMAVRRDLGERSRTGSCVNNRQRFEGNLKR